MTFWLSRYVQLDEISADAAIRHDPDLIIENFSALKLGDHGAVEYTVAAGKMTHFRDDDLSILEKIVFTATQPNKPQVTATAPRGQLIKQADGADEVMMDGGVRVESAADAKNAPLSLTTPTLKVIPDQNIARSNDGVVMESPSGKLTAKTFVLNTDTRHLQFEGVKINYSSRSKR